MVADFCLGILIEKSSDPGKRRTLCLLSACFNISLLGYFKYISDDLPVGISFYTFESLSYIIDVYRRRVPAERSLLTYLAFIAMFPRFVAGPIVRFRDMTEQFASYGGPDFSRGLQLFFTGFFYKILFADSFATFVPYAFGRTDAVEFLSAVIGVFSFGMQIYFDFAGYSLMAIGLCLCLGFSIIQNFNRPYLTDSLQKFWSDHWHISLAHWLRDYVYVELGGNRKGELRTALNILVTMALAGIWHGSGFNFLLWGLWLGGFIILERFILPRHKFQWLQTQAIVFSGWVFFKAQDLNEIQKIFSGFFSPDLAFNPQLLGAKPMALGLSLIGVAYAFVFREKKLPGVVSVLLFLLALLIDFSSNQIPFLYFQF